MTESVQVIQERKRGQGAPVKNLRVRNPVPFLHILGLSHIHKDSTLLTWMKAASAPLTDYLIPHPAPPPLSSILRIRPPVRHHKPYTSSNKKQLSFGVKCLSSALLLHLKGAGAASRKIEQTSTAGAVSSVLSVNLWKLLTSGCRRRQGRRLFAVPAAAGRRTEAAGATRTTGSSSPAPSGTPSGPR